MIETVWLKALGKKADSLRVFCQSKVAKSIAWMLFQFNSYSQWRQLPRSVKSIMIIMIMVIIIIGSNGIFISCFAILRVGLPTISHRRA